MGAGALPGTMAVFIALRPTSVRALRRLVLELVIELHGHLHRPETPAPAILVGGFLEELDALRPLRYRDRPGLEHVINHLVIGLEVLPVDLLRPSGIEGAGVGLDQHVGVDEGSPAHPRALDHPHVRELPEVDPSVVLLGMPVVPDPGVPSAARKRHHVFVGAVAPLAALVTAALLRAPAVSSLEDQDFVPGLRKTTGGHRAPKARADHHDVVIVIVGHDGLLQARGPLSSAGSDTPQPAAKRSVRSTY